MSNVTGVEKPKSQAGPVPQENGLDVEYDLLWPLKHLQHLGLVCPGEWSLGPWEWSMINLLQRRLMTVHPDEQSMN